MRGWAVRAGHMGMPRLVLCACSRSTSTGRRRTPRATGWTGTRLRRRPSAATRCRTWPSSTWPRCAALRGRGGRGVTRARAALQRGRDTRNRRHDVLGPPCGTRPAGGCSRLRILLTGLLRSRAACRRCSTPCWRTTAASTRRACRPWRTRPRAPERCSAGSRSATTGAWSRRCKDASGQRLLTCLPDRPLCAAQQAPGLHHHGAHRDYRRCLGAHRQRLEGLLLPPTVARGRVCCRRWQVLAAICAPPCNLGPRPPCHNLQQLRPGEKARGSSITRGPAPAGRRTPGPSC